MNKINILDEATINKIAAGEVIERPASVVKELIENAIDAGASDIKVEIKGNGIDSIRIIDNGHGMSRDDASIAFLKHATSKISNVHDIDTVRTMGFRGEALSSITAVA
ncbi:MAG: DNA mismatch repair protein MutL, partial [Nitrospirae bacterium]|nr:DNA mismatch repair protein MutL [Nitrospirota bacterium]